MPSLSIIVTTSNYFGIYLLTPFALSHITYIFWIRQHKHNAASYVQLSAHKHTHTLRCGKICYCLRHHPEKDRGVVRSAVRFDVIARKFMHLCFVYVFALCTNPAHEYGLAGFLLLMLMQTFIYISIHLLYGTH